MNNNLLTEMFKINESILICLKSTVPNPLTIGLLLNEFITARNCALDIGGVRVANHGAIILAKTAPEMFKHEAVASLSSEIYFNSFETTIRAVTLIARYVKGAQRDSLVAMGVANLIKSEAFRTDSEPNLATGLIRSIIQHCADKEPAFRLCDEIIHQVNSLQSGARTIFDVVYQIANTMSPAKNDTASLMGWIATKEDILTPLVSEFPIGSVSKNKVSLFHEAGLHNIANTMYFRSEMLDAKILIDLYKCSGLKPDREYLSQFLDVAYPQVKHLRELLKYSLVVENVFPAEWMTSQTWVVSSLVDAFKRLRESSIQPKSPADCQPLFSALSKHVKSDESVEPLMTKMIRPYLEGSMDLRSKMFTQSLGL